MQGGFLHRLMLNHCSKQSNLCSQSQWTPFPGLGQRHTDQFYSPFVPLPLLFHQSPTASTNGVNPVASPVDQMSR